MDELFDPTLYNNDESQLMEIKRCVEVALLCTQCDRADRPHMEDVLQMLRGLKELPTPKKPSYMLRPFTKQTVVDLELSAVYTERRVIES